MYCLLCEQNFILTFTETMRRGHTNCPVRSGSGSKIRKMEELKQLVESYGQILISQEYPGSRGTIKIKCNICDDIYQKTIHNFRNNPKHTTCGNIILDREKSCQDCGQQFRMKNKEQKYCSQKCARDARIINEQRKCDYCNSIFRVSSNRLRFCNKECYLNYIKTDIGQKEWSNYGSKSAASQQRRSKNEIYMSYLCEQYFGKDKILSNEPIFDGWDADIIIPHLKIAILWNGIWHYQQISTKQSLVQIQTRDRIKLETIQKSGYIPYVIKDMGKYNTQFVEEQFQIFLQYLHD